MEPLERKVADFIRGMDLFSGARCVLLAVSGGADSVALLHVMHRLTAHKAVDTKLLCGHINHGLRGAAGDGDETFVTQEARKLDLPVVSRTVNVGAYAQEHHLSTETAARQLRLDTLIEIARAHGCAAIAMGHQKNDNAETIIQRLGRGTGLRGLGGIWPSRWARDGLALVHPLLECSRIEIVEYLRSRKLSWRDDHTNSDCVYTRNRIRHRLLPALQARSDSLLVEELASLAASARKLYARVADEAQQAATRHAEFSANEANVEPEALAALPEPVGVELVRQVLTRLGLGERDLSRRHYRSLLALTGPASGGQKVNLPGDFWAQRLRDTIVVRRPLRRGQQLADPVELRIPGTSQFGPYRIDAQILDAGQIKPAAITGKKNPFQEYLDLGRIRPPLVVRPRRPGDRFVPLGLHSQKKVGKFLTAAKVPGNLRSRAFVIEDVQAILWVCPIRISDRAKVTENTSIILDLSVAEV